MYQLNDDIVALATIAGKSAISVVRLSGSSSLVFYKKLLRTSKLPTPNYVNLVSLYHPKTKKLIDQAMVTFYKSPKSFTGEDCIEFSLHGGVVIANHLIDALVLLGAREAMPGEFSYRAFINDKIDLLQAEAIASVIESTNDLDSYYSLSAVKGQLSEGVKKSQSIIKNILTMGEHELDFNENEINFTKSSQYLEDLKKAHEIIKKTIKTSYTVEEKRSGIRLVIVGLPNAGKSSLFNVLVGKSKAIVTNISGTTRDVLEQDVYIKENLATLVDTAGLRRATNKIEKIGIKKSFEEIENSDIVLLVDEKDPAAVYSQIKNKIGKRPVVLVCNKSDINKQKSSGAVINVSCKNKSGIDTLITELSTIIFKKINAFKLQHSCLINKRQKELLINIDKDLEKTIQDYKTNNDLSLCLSLLYNSMEHFNTLLRPLGKNEILNDIFGGFCVGK